MAQFNFPILTGKQQYEKLKEKGLILDLPEADVIHFFDHHSYFQLVMYFQYYWKANEKCGFRNQKKMNGKNQNSKKAFE